MSNLQNWQDKIKQKRKQTSWKDFAMEVASWFPVVLGRNNWMISVFPETERSGNIVDKKQYFKDYENALSDENVLIWSFFDSFQNLFKESYKPNVIHFRENENSDFSHCVFGAKNVYLSFVIWEECENIAYCSVVYNHCSNVFYSVSIFNHCNNIYNCNNVSNSSNIFHSINIHNSSHVWNSSNLIWCHNCIECNGLENKSYYYQNKEYSKEEFSELQKNYQTSEYTLGKQLSNFASDNISGQGIFHSNEIDVWYCVNRLNGWRNICYIGGWNLCNDFYDVFESGLDSKDFYAVMNAWTNSHDVYCSCLIDNGSAHIFYSYFLDNCSYCIWCVWLKNKSYCILNKQYTKEDWHEKMNQIFTQLEEDWDLGSFFPWSMNPFHFNDTAAAFIHDFTKEEVEAEWYLWRDNEVKVDIPEGTDVISINDLDDFESLENDTWNIDKEILRKVIKDDTWNYYRIVKPEYDFLIKHSLPLPRKHWFDRIKNNFWITK